MHACSSAILQTWALVLVPDTASRWQNAYTCMKSQALDHKMAQGRSEGEETKQNPPSYVL